MLYCMAEIVGELKVFQQKHAPMKYNPIHILTAASTRTTRTTRIIHDTDPMVSAADIQRRIRHQCIAPPPRHMEEMRDKKQEKALVPAQRQTTNIPASVPSNARDAIAVVDQVIQSTEMDMNILDSIDGAIVDATATNVIKEHAAVEELKEAEVTPDNLIEEIILDDDVPKVDEPVPQEHDVRAPISMSTRHPPIATVAAPRAYFMNNRERFVSFIDNMFSKYRQTAFGTQPLSCDSLLSTDNSAFTPMAHQKIIRDYLSLETPYRGLLLNHGLGSGKTCSSIAAAEGLKNKEVIVMTPASLRRNYLEEIKKCGNSMYRTHQFWEWVPIESPKDAAALGSIIGLPEKSVRQRRGAWVSDISEPLKAPNYTALTAKQKVSLNKQINEMIQTKYHFINYNGITRAAFSALTDVFKKNIFNDKVIVIDEAHNFVSRIVNKIRNKVWEKRMDTKDIAIIMYEFLMKAERCKILLLTGTPVINYPNEIGVLFNILRGYIKTWTFSISSDLGISKDTVVNALKASNSVDYINYVATSKTLTITRNPFGFVTKRTAKQVYDGVQYVPVMQDDTDAEFIKSVKNLLSEHGIRMSERNPVTLKLNTALPDTLTDFGKRFVDTETLKVRNMDQFKRRIIGLASYFRSLEELLPTYDPDADFHLVEIPMSDPQMVVYEKYREEEREREKKAHTARRTKLDENTDMVSTYRVFSRMACNIVLPTPPGRPRVLPKKFEPNDAKTEDAKKADIVRVMDEKAIKAAEAKEAKDTKADAKAAKAAEAKEAKDIKADAKVAKSAEVKATKAAEAKEAKAAKMAEAKEAKAAKAAEKAAEKAEAKEAKVVKAAEAKAAKEAEKAAKEAEKAAKVAARDAEKAKKQAAKAVKDEQKAIRMLAKEIAGGAMFYDGEEEEEEDDEEEDEEEEEEDDEEEEEEDDEEEDDEEEEEEDDEYAFDDEEDEEEGEYDEYAFDEEDEYDMLGGAKGVEKEANDVDTRTHDELEGDEVLEQEGGEEYAVAMKTAMTYISEHKEELLGREALKINSPKFLAILNNIEDPDKVGLHMLYSQFRTLEGITLFAMTLDTNGFARFKIRSTGPNSWDIDMSDANWNNKEKLLYALYTGTESADEREIIRNIYNGDWGAVPNNIATKLRTRANNNSMGDIIKLLMITSAGSEGINLRNTRYVHIMEPYWHMVRIEQVIGRARRICSHQSLPKELRTVEVFLYIMVLTKEQIESDAAAALRMSDVSRKSSKIVHTTDQKLFEVSTIKAEMTTQILRAVKEASVDCATHRQSNIKEGIVCLSFGTNVPPDARSYAPNIDNDQHDTVANINRIELNWKAREFMLPDGSRYILREDTGDVYDYDSVMDIKQQPMRIGKLVREKGRVEIQPIL